LIPVIRQYIRRLYKGTGLVAIHSPAVGSRSRDCTFHCPTLLTLELNVEKTKRLPLPRIEHVSLIFVYVTYTVFCAKNRKIAGSIPASAIGIFH